jgi:putative transposase
MRTTLWGRPRHSAGRHQPRRSTSTYYRCNEPVLLPLVESGQFRARKMVHRLNRHHMVGSMGRVGAAGDNAAMESVFSLLQKNVLDRRSCNTREELRIAIITWIERTYHRRRRQAALGRLTPIEYELIVTPTATQAAQPELSPVRAADPFHHESLQVGLGTYVRVPRCLSRVEAFGHRTHVDPGVARLSHEVESRPSDPVAGDRLTLVRRRAAAGHGVRANPCNERCSLVGRVS